MTDNTKPRNWTRSNLQVSLMPESYIQMMDEIRKNHPNLWGILRAKPMDTSDVLAEVGAYLGLEMDGEYTINQTSDDFYMLLRGRGSSIILPVQGQGFIQ
jgi:hypothetical protein